jgi:methionyl-tRNA synthetase
VGCEQYKSKSELVNSSICPDHNRECEIHEEEAYLFALSKYQERLEALIASDEILIRPETRKNEVLSFIRGGLEDVAISRKKENVSWGIDLPFDKTQTTYVWIDAFLNYLTGLGWPEDTKKSDKFWPANVQLMAKDISRVHATIWQAMLLALKLPTTKQLYVHGYFTVNGKKMSKSLGNVLEPNALVEKFGTDAVRYAVLREFPFGEDGDISEEKISNRYNYELANGVGNLLQRTVVLINKFEIPVKTAGAAPATEEALKHIEEVNLLIENLDFSNALFTIWNSFIKPANEIMETKKPWELAKFDLDEAANVLTYCLGNLNHIADLLAPFMPETSEKMKKQLQTLKSEPLFPRIDAK